MLVGTTRKGAYYFLFFPFRAWHKKMVHEVLWKAGGKLLMAPRPKPGDSHTYVENFTRCQLQDAFPEQCYPATREGLARLLPALCAAAAVPAVGTTRD
jgi:hypothetical protein